MYEPLLFIHSWTRWAVFLALFFFFARSVKGLLLKENWGAKENYFVWAFNQVFGYQILFGLTLWLGLSPFTKAAFKDSSLLGENPVVTFWTIRHGLTMIVAFGVWHMGRARLRRAPAESKFRIASLTLGFILALIVSAIPWPWLEYGRPFLRWLF